MSCKKDAGTGPPPTNITGAIDPALTTGTWRIGFFSHNSEDQTNNYTAYKFQFIETGNVTVTNNDVSYNGSWMGSDDNSQLKLNLNFMSNSPLDLLSHDWTVFQQTSTQINLRYVNGKDNTDFLTLNKNLVK